MRRVLMLGIALFLLAGCGSSDSSGPSTTFTGAYVGTERFTSGASGSTSMNVTVVQSGSSITGSYSTGAGDRGSVTGTLSGDLFQGTAASAVIGVSCALQGTVGGGGASFSGTVACQNGVGAQITLTRA